MARATWYRLDIVGKFYSSQAGSSAQTVFRYSATMADGIDAQALQRALAVAVDSFPGFNVRLRSGMFWHYLEPAPDVPEVAEESLPICFGLHVNAKSVLFRVSYWRDRISFEVSHMVSDGRGSLSFFKALVYAYVRERYGVSGVPLEHGASDHQKAENSFDKYFERGGSEDAAGGAKGGGGRGQKVYRLSGWRDVADPTFAEYHLPAGRVIALAKSYGVGLTALVTAAVMCAIRDEMPRRERNRAIRLDIPVDLRQHFKSETTKNFFSLAFVSYTPGTADEPVQEVARQVAEQLKTATMPDQLTPRLSKLIGLEKNWGLRFAPLFAKDAVLALADWMVARETTTTVSNLGRIVLDERIAPFVRDANIMSSTNGLTFTLCSFGDDLSIGISTAYSNPDVVKNLVRFFSGQGIEGRININKTSDEVAEDRLEAKLETSVKRLSGQAPGKGESQ